MHAEQGYVDEWVLVLAAAGGVGIAAIQIAKGRFTPSSIHPSLTNLIPFLPKIVKRLALVLLPQHLQASLRLLAWRAVQTL